MIATYSKGFMEGKTEDCAADPLAGDEQRGE
jgi:hypothetical protein